MPSFKNSWFYVWSTVIVFVGIDATGLQFDIYRHVKVPIKEAKSADDKLEYVDLYKYLNSEYYSVIKIGSPAKEFKVTFDTSWGDSWLPSQHCAFTEISCLIHTRYDSSKSSTYEEDGRDYDRSSKEMTIKGFFSRDDFHLPHVRLNNQTFVEVTHLSKFPFVFTKADGIIGMALKDLSVEGTQSFFYNLLTQKVIKEGIFAFYMNRDPTTEEAGILYLGGTHRSHAKGNMTVLDVIPSPPGNTWKYWTIKMDRVVVDKGEKSHIFCRDGCNADLDTSSNQIIGPRDEIEKINDLIQAKKFSPTWPYRYIVDCRQFAKLPEITFFFAEKEFKIQSKYYVQHMTYYGFTVCLSPFTEGDDKSWVLGGAFLMQFYTEFDVITRQVGIAKTKF